jgi:hypothetical protein
MLTRRLMMSTHPDSTLIFASDGTTIHGLRLGARADGSPVLLDTAGLPVAPWEVELVHWPLEAEPELQRGGYLPGRPADMELWCNCAD